MVLVNGLKRQKRNVRAEEAKNKVPRGKSFAGYDQEDEYDDVIEDDFAPFVEAVELGLLSIIVQLLCLVLIKRLPHLAVVILSHL